MEWKEEGAGDNQGLRLELGAGGDVGGRGREGGELRDRRRKTKEMNDITFGSRAVNTLSIKAFPRRSQALQVMTPSFRH